MISCLAAGVLVTVMSCARKTETPRQPVLRTGEGRLAVDGGSIWYRASGAAGGTPLVLLHGGPGFSSYYMKPLDALSADRQVIRYDQLGSGKSDRTSDTALFTIAHFVNELDSLRASFGCPSWHLLGHSWGTVLALEYYRVHPERVASMTFCSPVSVDSLNAAHD